MPVTAATPEAEAEFEFDCKVEFTENCIYFLENSILLLQKGFLSMEAIEHEKWSHRDKS